MLYYCWNPLSSEPFFRTAEAASSDGWRFINKLGEFAAPERIGKAHIPLRQFGYIQALVVP